MKLQKNNIDIFQKKILEWYRINKRDLPWRTTRKPYNILISECMSQQTQLSRVIPKYKEWIDTFPTLATLADASFPTVLRIWSGLGYNRRAQYLHKLAQILISSFQGNFPQTQKELIALPGIGTYTARALLCFSFNHQVAVVDTNIRKVLLVEFLQGKDTPEKELYALATQLLPKNNAYEWNQALMDYASVQLKNNKIPLPKQKPFKGSDRYYRGKILRYLLAHTVEEKQLYVKLTTDTQLSLTRYHAIIARLYKEGFIEKKQGKIILSDNKIPR